MQRLARCGTQKGMVHDILQIQIITNLFWGSLNGSLIPHVIPMTLGTASIYTSLCKIMWQSHSSGTIESIIVSVNTVDEMGLTLMTKCNIYIINS